VFAVSADDRDFPYKLFGKRLAWSLGFTPLINVPVRIPADEGGKPGRDITDADVLGFRFEADGTPAAFLADCKDTTGDSVDRVFWLKGLGAYFDARSLYLLKRRVPDNARWLASRLGISSADEQMVKDAQQRLRLDELKGPYFDGTGYAALHEAANSFPKSSPYRAIGVFLTSTFWMLPYVERLQSILDLLNDEEMNKKFNPDDERHQYLVLEASFRLGLALGFVLSNLGTFDLSTFQTRLRETLHGGRESFQQRLKYARALKSMSKRGAGPDDTELDLPSFPNLVEVTYRLAAKRYALNDAIRYLDVARHYHAAKVPVPESSGFMRSALARKFAQDILVLFISANNLNDRFKTLADRIAAASPDEGADPESASRTEPLATKSGEVGIPQVSSSVAAGASPLKLDGTQAALPLPDPTKSTE
jgi:hypothetical protein